MRPTRSARTDHHKESEDGMKRNLAKHCIGACLLTSVLTAGCRHGEKHPLSDASPSMPASSSRTASTDGMPGQKIQGDNYAQSLGPPDSQGIKRTNGDAGTATGPGRLDYKYAQPWQTADNSTNPPIGYPGATPVYGSNDSAGRLSYTTNWTNPERDGSIRKSGYNLDDNQSTGVQTADYAVPPYRKPRQAAESWDRPKPEWPDAPTSSPAGKVEHALYTVGGNGTGPSRSEALVAPASAGVLDGKLLKPAGMSVDGSKPSPAPSAAELPTAPVETTIKATYGHAEDYHWLNGQVQYSGISKAWRLRYAPPDEVDPYGGSVTLIDNGTLSSLKDGQYVRVQGHVVGSPEKAVAPPYKAESIQVVPEKN